MAAPSCSECGGTRWVRYFSETTDGNFEEAYRLCSCNYEPQKTRSEHPCKESTKHLGITVREQPNPFNRSA
jgi:predicted metal-binding protein